MGKQPTKKPVAESSFEQIDPALGAFVRQLEWLVWTMRRFVMECFKRNGLKNGRLILTVMSEVTAGPLRNWIALIYEQACPEDPEGLETLREVLKKVGKIIEARNHFLHSFYIDALVQPEAVLTENFNRRAGHTASHHSVKDLQKYMGFMDVVRDHLEKAILNIRREHSIERNLSLGLLKLPLELPSFKVRIFKRNDT